MNALMFHITNDILKYNIFVTYVEIFKYFFLFYRISPTPKPETIPRGCIAILGGCVYRRVLASDRKTDCYKGLGLTRKTQGNQLKTRAKPQTKLASLPEVLNKKKIFQANTAKSKPTSGIPLQQIQRIQQKLQQNIKQKQKLQQMQQNTKQQKMKQNGKQQQMQQLGKQQRMQKNLNQNTKVQIKIQKQQNPPVQKTIPKDKNIAPPQKLPLNLNTSIQPFEVNSILNGKDTFLVISLKNKVQERSKPKVNPQKATPPPAEQGPPGESNQSEQQQELVSKLQRSLNGEYDFTMMDYYNMFSNFQQQTTPALNAGNEATTFPTTTSGSAGNMFESNQVSVIAIKSSNTEFMKWLIDTLGNLGLINSSTNQTKNGTSHRDKLEMVLKQLVQNKTSSPTGNEFMTTVDNSPTYTFGGNKNDPPTQMADVNKLVSVFQAAKGLALETTSTTPTSETQSTKLTSKLKTKLLDNIIDKMVQDVLRRKKLDNTNKVVKTKASATVAAVTTDKPTEAPPSVGLFSNIGLFGLLDSMSK